MPRPDLGEYVGTAWDADHGYTPETGMAKRDGALQYRPASSRYQVDISSFKYCLTCKHWARMHPGHGPCHGRTYAHWRGPNVPCGCPGFADPEPGRPDQVYSRDQIDRMLRFRWEAKKDRIYLLKDGRYGLLDPWTDKEKYFA
jgi:hypothetical protein